MPDEQPPLGYSSFASFITGSEDKSCMIFRRFDQVNVRNLLILESEIADLEATLKRLEAEGGRTSLSKEGLQYWALLREQAQGHEDAVVKQCAQQIVDVTKELDVKLTKYHKALLRMAELMKLSSPETRALVDARSAFNGWSSGNAKPPRSSSMIDGAMKNHLDVRNEPDLSTLIFNEFTDPLSRLLRRRYFAFSSRRVLRSVSIISALTATIFLVTAIVALYFISNPVARLGTLCGFTIIFAANVASFTNARRYEVFVATAAYAAVLVVFISGNFAANISNYYSTQDAANAQLANAVQTVTVTATEPIGSMGTIIETATMTATITQAIETVFVTVSATASPRSTSAAAKKGLNSYSTPVKAGIGIAIACAAAFGLALLVALLICLCGSIAGFIGMLKKAWKACFKSKEASE